MSRFRKKSVEIDAVQYVKYGELVTGMCNSKSCYVSGNNKPHVHTMHDGQIVNLEIGDWVIPDGLDGTYYPCKPDIFELTYEPVEAVSA